MNKLDDFKDIIVTPNDFIIDKKYIIKTDTNNIYNKIIIDYYKTLKGEGSHISDIKINKIKECNRFWKIERYDYNLIKDFIRTNLCDDKFCNNCKKVKQASRMSRYIPELEKYKDRLYHLTLTLPNVVGADLKDTIYKMKKGFRQLVRYINCTDRLTFIDFSKYKYKGAIRSLEITFKADNYHPHYHCAFVFDNLDLDKKYKNNYSIDYYNNREDRLFSEFEIIIQKLWYLIINNIRVDKDNYNNLDIGYSCICDKFEDDDYIELFKYMTKETDEKDNILTYDNFKTLYNATYNVKQIQGYGKLYMINDNNIMDEVDKIYIDIKEFLNNKEKPITIYEDLLSLLNDTRYDLISRKKIYQYLKKYKESE
ncbi:MAG: protein rep [Bacilli bacterium]|nr:protein rep [Bacilli bacterium]